ncbi:MAG: DoxX family membrane protein [Deltaproteobacteria bacterium]|nr:DoxX family membrane protein [Deltaproteobacteria bacterium]
MVKTNTLVGLLERPEVTLGCRLLVGLVFILAAWPKILHPEAFARLVYNYRLLPDGAVNLVAIILPWLELVMGLALVLGIWTRTAALIIILMMIVFVGAMGSALIRGLNVQCGCFSVQKGEGQLTWLSLLRDGGVILPALQVAWFDKGIYSIIRGKQKECKL